MKESCDNLQWEGREGEGRGREGRGREGREGRKEKPVLCSKSVI